MLISTNGATCLKFEKGYYGIVVSLGSLYNWLLAFWKLLGTWQNPLVWFPLQKSHLMTSWVRTLLACMT